MIREIKKAVVLLSWVCIMALLVACGTSDMAELPSVTESAEVKVEKEVVTEQQEVVAEQQEVVAEQQEVVAEPVQTNSGTYLGNFKVTHYCACAKCCGSYAYNRPKDANGNDIVLSASGMMSIAGYTVGVDPKVIPYGTKIMINGREYMAADTGAFRGNHIDMFCGSHDEVNAGGAYYADVYRLD